MFLSLNKVLFIFLWSVFVCLSVGFNIDVINTVTLRGFSDPGSYFGYSVGIAVNDNTGNKWILVGAPRSNDPAFPNVPRPGAVFACTLPSQGNSTCTKLNIDETKGLDSVNIGGRTITFKHGRNDSWLGGSIDVFTSGSSNVFATCAHKWYNTYFYEVRDYVYMQGLCYEVPLDLNMTNVKKIPAMTNDVLRTIYIPETDQTVWLYGFAGLGISVHYTKNANHLLLGAAGIFDWIGGFVDLEGQQVKIMRNAINNTDIIKPNTGYSSTSGMYFADDQTYLVFGAPRVELMGMSLPVNSYYGATLCTMDINNDKNDDLFVGAPMYSPLKNNHFTQELEIGMVFVYLGSRLTMKFKSPPETLKGTFPKGRFGSAIASLGDINSDNFDDVAVGAPYEDNFKGAVYIYNGYTGGVWPKYSQRIYAADIDTGLRGFGISIASGKDVNIDNINDTVVGSYLSDKAVVMFGQHVIELDADLKVLNITGDPTVLIDMDGDKHETVNVCFRFHYHRCDYLRLNLSITLDAEKGDLRRIKFVKNNESSIKNVLHVARNSLVCAREQLTKKSTNDIVSEIVIQADYDIAEINCSGIDNSVTIRLFHGLYPDDPVLQLREKFQFRKNCKQVMCKTDLTLLAVAEFANISEHFLSRKSELAVDISITKFGDTAYATVFDMVYPKYLSYIHMEYLLEDLQISCYLADPSYNNSRIVYSEDRSALTCSLGNIISNVTSVNFRLVLELMTSGVDIDSVTELQMLVTTISTDINPTDNNETLPINLQRYPVINFDAIAMPQVVTLVGYQQRYRMKNIYKVYNTEGKHISATVNISYPQIQRVDKALLFLNQTKIRCGQTCEAECQLALTYTTPIVYSYFNGQHVSSTEKPVTSLSDIQNADCLKQICSIFTCTLRNLQPKSTAYIYTEFVIDSEIETIIKEGESVELISIGSVEIGQGNIQNMQVSATLRKRIIKPLVKELSWWAIPLSVLCGNLLLSLIIVLLWKVGFFERKLRDELIRRKAHISNAGQVTGKMPTSYAGQVSGKRVTDDSGQVSGRKPTADAGQVAGSCPTIDNS
ncbi:integrin alpha-9-like isoform X2 [Mercenaria mercenaria]|uniref:integrin alpha-9-like isoform X2 n=1 Tax=Mercenaria mercenaria TaxID=6596 RepID=UPI00234F25EB|nr:integrin alpha-9-like isoform X2 [Mercenaria mercenaria]